MNKAPAVPLKRTPLGRARLSKDSRFILFPVVFAPVYDEFSRAANPAKGDA